MLAHSAGCSDTAKHGIRKFGCFLCVTPHWNFVSGCAHCCVQQTLHRLAAMMSMTSIFVLSSMWSLCWLLRRNGNIKVNLTKKLLQPPRGFVTSFSEDASELQWPVSTNQNTLSAFFMISPCMGAISVLKSYIHGGTILRWGKPNYF